MLGRINELKIIAVFKSQPVYCITMGIVRNTALLTATNLIVRLGGYIYRIVFARLLSVYEYGILNLALPLQFLIVVLASSGIAPTVARFTAQGSRREVRAFLGYSLVISILFAGVVVVLSPAVAKYIFHEPRVAKPLAIASISLPFAVAFAVFTGVLQGEKKFKSFSALLISLQVGRLLFSIVLGIISATAVYVIVGSVAGFVVASGVAFFLLRSRIGVSFDRAAFTRIFRFAIPVSITGIAAFALSYIDTLVIGFFYSPHEVGIYSVASPTSRLLLAFSSGLYATVLPSVSELRESEDVKKLAIKATKLSYAVLIFFTAIFIAGADLIIQGLFGSQYAGAVEPFRILLIGSFFFGVFTLNSALLQGVGLPKVPMKILLLSAVIDFVLNLTFVPVLGIKGAAIASSTSLAVAGVLTQVYLLRLWW